MAALTQTEVANMALGLLTEAPIDNLDEDSRAARMMRLHFETTRESELTKRAWVFALKSEEVEPEERNSSPWRYGYELPADALRALPLMEGAYELEWIAEGSQILTMQGGRRSIQYIANLIDPNDWPSVFTDVLAAALAMKVAHSITGKTSAMQIAQQSYENAIATAMALNAVQKRGRAPSGLWEQARAGYASGSHGARARHGWGL